MRLLLDYRPALVRRTGVGEYTHEMARALAARLEPPDWLTLFSSSWKDRLEPGRIPNASVVDARIPVHLLNLAWHRAGWPPIERLAGPVDVAHSMHPLLMPARRAAQVVTIYDLFYLSDARGTAREIRRDYVRLTTAHARRADAVVVISEHMHREVVTRLGVAPEQVVLCPPGAPAWTPRHRPTRTGPILFVGSAERRKNLPVLLRAYAQLRERLPEAPALILAGRPPTPSDDVTAMLGRAPWDRAVQHRGYVTEAQRLALYREASMLVLPSLDEGFGMPVLEAMTVGVPVVTANRGALPEVLGDAGTLVDPADEHGLSCAMQRILQDSDYGQRCTELGLRRAARYSWADSAGRLLQAYRDAVSRRDRRR